MSTLSGAELARLFHAEVIGPALARGLPGLRYAAGRLGSGSDVLGFDDAMSRDHDWGCRLTLLVDETDRAAIAGMLELLERQLPDTFRGLPVRFPVTWNQAATHQVAVATVGEFAVSRLGVDPTKRLSVQDWLILDGQAVLEVTAGPVFTDQTATLGPARASLRWYPPNLDRYVLAAGWQRIEQQMPLMGRCAMRGDELGSRLLSAELAADLIALAFLLSRRWAPYPKWRGVAFRSLPVGAQLEGLLDTAVSVVSWRDRERALARACEVLLEVQRDRGLPGPERAVMKFWDRPFLTVDPAVATTLLVDITDPQVRSLPRGVGSAGQWIDNVDVLTRPNRRRALRSAYTAWADDADADRGGVR